MTPIKNLHASVKEICGDASQVVVYGFEHCDYRKVRNWLTPPPASSPCKLVLNYECGDPRMIHKTLEGHTISKISVPLDSAQFPRICKAAIPNLVFLNYTRKKKGKNPIIPFLFIMDKDNNPYPATAENLASKEAHLNGLITHKEYRRCYKVAVLFPNAEIREVAKSTFKFVKFKKDGGLELMDPPWMDKNWSNLWDARIKTKKTSEIESSKDSSWRKDLSGMIETFDLSEKIETLTKPLDDFSSSSSSASSNSSSNSFSSSSSLSIMSSTLVG